MAARVRDCRSCAHAVSGGHDLGYRVRCVLNDANDVEPGPAAILQQAVHGWRAGVTFSPIGTPRKQAVDCPGHELWLFSPVPAVPERTAPECGFSLEVSDNQAAHDDTDTR